MNFECPKCKGSMENEDIRSFDKERIQCGDDLNGDPLSRIDTRIELWYCCSCGSYFRVYFKLERITALTESE